MNKNKNRDYNYINWEVYATQMKFEILLDVPAQKFLKKTDTGTTSRIIEAIEKLADDPIPHDSKRIMGHVEKLFRIRAGKFRILYRVDYTNHLIVVIKIDSRDKVYGF